MTWLRWAISVAFKRPDLEGHAESGTVIDDRRDGTVGVAVQPGTNHAYA
jgi:hypothetical protein